MGFLQTEALLNRGPFGAVKKGIQTLSDLFEPYAILQDFYPRTGIYPQELRAVAPIWLSPSISGRRKVLDMFRVISEDVYRGFNELQRGLALYEFEVNYDEKMGGFRDTSSRRFGEKGLPPIVYATENAIGVARHLVTNIEEGQPLGYANAVAIFGEEKVDGVINFIKKSQDQSGGFHHNPESVRLQPRLQGMASVWNTQRAMSVLWNLEQGNYGTDSAERFILACMVTDPNGKIGFRERESVVDSPEPSSEATASALNILDMIGDRQWIQEHKSGLIDFLKSCWKVNKKGLGGFGHIPGSELTLLYTNAVLSSLDFMEADIDDLLPNDESRQQLIKLYITQCRSREQGKFLFGFAPGWAPNSHIMRETMYTLRQLAKKHPDFQALWNTIYGDTEKVIRGIYEFPVELTPELAKELGG